MVSRLKALRWLVLAATLVVWSCGSSNNRAPAGAGGLDAAGGGGGGDVSDGSIGAGGACVERPNDLLRPPSGRLPCELIPPGVQL
jgi:hypothetical protein